MPAISPDKVLDTALADLFPTNLTIFTLQLVALICLLGYIIPFGKSPITAII